MPTDTLIKAQEVVTDGIFRPAAVTTNFDQNLISPHIADAEINNVIRLLGISLYDDMVANQNPIPSNYNPDAGALVQKFPTNSAYEALWVKYLLRYEGLIVYVTALPFIGLQTTPQGVLKMNTEYAENTGMEGVKFLQNEIQRRIDNLEPLIEAYLCDNAADFPKFDEEKRCNSCKDHNPYEYHDYDYSYCSCGYTDKHNNTKHCPTCKRGRQSSNNIIFY